MQHTAQKPAQVKKYCQDQRPGGGQIRLPGTATDQTAPANEAMRMATPTPKRMLDTVTVLPDDLRKKPSRRAPAAVDQEF